MIISLQYLMYFFMAGSIVEPEYQWSISSAAIVILVLIFFVNFIALVYLTVCRLCFFWRVRKARKAFLKVRVRRNAMYKKGSSTSMSDAQLRSSHATD